MYNEAAKLAIKHHKRKEFDEVINFVTPNSLRKKLMEEF